MRRKRDTGLYVQEMLESIQTIERYCVGVTAEQFAANSLLQDAVILRLEIIGEAAKHVAPAVRARYPSVPWRRFAGLRDVLIDDYPGVAVERVWQVVTTELPTAKQNLLQDQSFTQGS